MLPAVLEYPSGDWNGFRIYRPAREGRSCEHFGGYKTKNRIPFIKMVESNKDRFINVTRDFKCQVLVGRSAWVRKLPVISGAMCFLPGNFLQLLQLGELTIHALSLLWNWYRSMSAFSQPEILTGEVRYFTLFKICSLTFDGITVKGY